MPLTLAVTPLPDLYRVQLDITEAPGTITVTRTGPDGVSVVVRGAQNVTPISGSLTTYDYEAPLGMDVTYTASSGAEVAVGTPAPVRLDVDTPVLSHPSLLSLTQAVVIASDDPEWEASTVLHRIHLRRDPVASVQPLRRRGGTLTLFLPDVAAADALMAAWADGWPLLLRVPCSNVRGGWLSAESISESATGSPAAPGRTATIRYQVVAEPPVAAYITSRWTFEDVPLAHGTFGDVTVAYRSFADLRGKTPISVTGLEALL